MWHQNDCGVAGGFPHDSSMCENAGYLSRADEPMAHEIDGFYGITGLTEKEHKHLSSCLENYRNSVKIGDSK